MSAPGRTAYDERAVHPGPTVDAALAGLVGGLLTARALAEGPEAAALVLVLAPALAGVWSGRHDPHRWARQGLVAGVIVGAWAAAVDALPAGMTAALVFLDGARAAVLAGTQAAGPAMEEAESVGVLATSARTLSHLLRSGLLALGGAALGRIRSPHAARPLDPWLVDHARRLALALCALAALLPGGIVSTGAPQIGAALALSELLFHSVAAVLVGLVVRGAWRLPRTAPETPARVAVDLSFVALLLVALAAGRVTAGGPLGAWLAPLLPWGAMITVVAWRGRPAPPPTPPRGPVFVADALAFAALAMSTVVGLAALRLSPALIRPLAVDPLTASLADATADTPSPLDLIAEATRVVDTVGPVVVGLALGLAAATWIARWITASWLGRAAAAPQR